MATNNMTDDSVVITQKIIDILEANADNLGLAAVYYGDQEDLLPRYPALAVESWPKERKFIGTSQFQITFRVGIMVFHGKIQPRPVTVKQTEELARAIELKLLENTRLDGLVIFGYVTKIEPGVAVKKSAMLQSTRITWEGISHVTFNE